MGARRPSVATERCCSRPRRSLIPSGSEVATMSSNRTGSYGRSAVIFADESTSGGAPVFGRDASHQVVPDGVGHTSGALACAAAAMERVEQEIELLWRRSMTAEDA